MYYEYFFSTVNNAWSGTNRSSAAKMEDSCSRHEKQALNNRAHWLNTDTSKSACSFHQVVCQIIVVNSSIFCQEGSRLLVREELCLYYSSFHQDSQLK